MKHLEFNILFNLHINIVKEIDPILLLRKPWLIDLK